MSLVHWDLDFVFFYLFSIGQSYFHDLDYIFTLLRFELCGRFLFFSIKLSKFHDLNRGFDKLTRENS